MRFGFLTISSPDGKRSPPERFAFLVFYSLSDHLNMGVRLSSLKVTGQSIFSYYFHYPPDKDVQVTPDPPLAPLAPLAPHTPLPMVKGPIVPIYTTTASLLFSMTAVN